MKVLIVDDEEDVRDSLQELFADEGFEVETAPDGAAALRQLNEEETLPCVVILDLLMPVLGGDDLYRKMQSDPRLATIPVIVSTSDPARAPGGLLIMKKPINLDRLLGAVRRFCAQ